MIVELPTSTTDELSRRDELSGRLRWLVMLRWVALAGVCLAIAVAGYWNLVASVWPLVAVAAAMGILNLGFYGLHASLPVRTLRALSSEALLQIAVDVVGLGLMIFFAGGLANPFIFYICFHGVIAAILLDRREAYTVALLTAGVVALLGVAEFLGWHQGWEFKGALASNVLSPLALVGMQFAIGTTLLFSVYMVTAIMEHLRARTRDVRRLNADLNERVEALASAERRLAAEHQRARAILECMKEGVVVVDLSGKVLLANSAAQQSALLALEDTLKQAGCRNGQNGNQYCHGPLAGENLLQHHHEHPPGANTSPEHGDGHEHQHTSERPAEAVARDSCPMGNPTRCLQEALEKGGQLCPATLALLGADVTVHPPVESKLVPPRLPTLAEIELQGRRFENTVSAVRAGQETVGLVVVSRDVTEQRSLYRQVLHSETLNALGNLAAGVAHELNTPLGTILGYAQMLLEEESAPRHELKAIEDQARRCRRIVQGLLDFARKSETGREPYAPNDLARKIRDLLAHAMKLRGIELKLDLSDPPPPKVVVASSEIEQVLVNLITNAADAIEMAIPGRISSSRLAVPAAVGASGAAAQAATSGATETAAGFVGEIVIVTRLEHGNEVLIAVQDDGPGVAEELVDEIFEPFFTTKVAGRGTGLGLSIARRIIEDHNGKLLLARPSAQKGARFEVRLRAGV